MSELNIKDVIRSEYVKCLTDPIHFMRKYCMVQHPTRGRVNFNLYPFQEQVLKLWLKNDYTIINKSPLERLDEYNNTTQSLKSNKINLDDLNF